MRDSFRIPPRNVTRFAVALAALSLGASGPKADPRVVAPARIAAAQPVEVTPSPHVTPYGPPTPSLEHVARTGESMHMLSLRSAAFPSPNRAGALAYVPAGIDPRAPLSVVVFIHGWNGCALSVSSDQPVPCHPQGPRRGHLALMSQLRASNRAAVLVVPQMAMEARSSAYGQLGEPGGMRRFLAEVLTQLEPDLGSHSVEDIQHLVLASHSGGYVTVARLLALDEVRFDEVALFDSLYLQVPVFQHYITAHLDRFAPGAEQPLRFVSLYREGGTMSSTRALERLVAQPVQRHSPAISVLSRRTPSRLTLDEARAPIVFARVNGDHQQAVRLNLSTVLQSSGIPEIVR